MLEQSQRERLQIIHAYEWAADTEADSNANLERLYHAIETVEELWFASFIIPLNPEGGDFSLILDHPLCDRGIASFLYWALDPVKLYAEFESAKMFVPALQLLRQIESRLLSGYYQSAVVGFSPTMLDRQLEHDRIPTELRAPTKGIHFSLDYRDAVFAPRY
ncbi:hypothetical protein SH528x_003604 [Novipirellula sp. SH528]|uniref:hypothetical protein n=1 Tax=Novipirellula sp. SH528 TaxID=3454466 RepID=UPI003F9EC4F9